ncbi:MAG: hypothetical protein IJD81_07015 [Oscillospiraceae bacterium]|nr:hypothetical protein [Oscillospiraceae bacterium]
MNHTNNNLSPEDRLAQLQQEYDTAQKELRRLERNLQRQRDYNVYLRQNYDAVVQSAGHRLLERYYRIRQTLRISTLLGAVTRKTAPLMQKLTHLKHRITGNLTQEDMFQIVRKTKRFQILPTASTETLAVRIHESFKRANVPCTLLASDDAPSAAVPYLLIDPAQSIAPAGIFMIYLTSQATLPDDGILNSAYAIWCSSQTLITELTARGIPVSKLYYCPADFDSFNEHNPSSITPITYYTYRFLLANDCISFDTFYAHVGSYFSAISDKLCLTLPETPDRKASFDKDNAYGFNFFPGLKHHIGWIGCGMSYKMIFRLAAEHLTDSLLLCEDDVFFSDQFPRRWAQIDSYLKAHTDWDIFSGIMADMGNVSILEYVEADEDEYVYIDRMMSMVFNVYTPKLYPILADWNPDFRDKAANTIDRYLETKCSRVLTTCPFLVGHKEDLDSTIWNHKNAEYNPGIESSSKRLSLLIAAYLAK